MVGQRVFAAARIGLSLFMPAEASDRRASNIIRKGWWPEKRKYIPPPIIQSMIQNRRILLG
jgi:hypothetical protein